GEARRSRVGAVATPLPTKELGEVVGAGEQRVDRGSANGEEDAEEGEDQADLAERDLGAHGDRAEEAGLDSLAKKEGAACDHEREGEEAAEAIADQRVRAVDPEILRRPAFLDSSRRVEIDLVRRHGRAEQADGEVAVEKRVARVHMR